MKKKQNILLLSMSTLPFSPADNSYYFSKRENDECIEVYKMTGISSLEPDSKLMIGKLAFSQERIDKIIVLCTDETLNARNEEKYGGLCAFDFYKCRMMDYTGQADKLKGITKEKYQEFLATWSKQPQKNPSELSDEEIHEILEKERVSNGITAKSVKLIPFPELKKLYADAEDNFIQAINISDGIHLHMFEVQNIIFSDPDAEVRVHYDMQGGLRDTNQFINAMLNMFRTADDFELAEAFITDFDKNNKIHKIKDKTLDCNIYDLVAGLNEFLRYGRGKLFYRYYQQYKKFKGYKEIPEDKIVSSIKLISNDILLCDIDSFDHDVRNLHERFQIYHDQEGKDPVFSNLVSAIEKDYSGIIQENELDLVAAVRWCLDKELLQQALVLLEAWSPDYMVRNSILYYAENQDELDKFKEYMKTVIDAKQPGQRKITEINHYFISIYVNERINKKFQKYKHYGTGADDQIRRINTLKRSYYELKRKRNALCHAEGSAKGILDKQSITKIPEEIRRFCSELSELKKVCNRKNELILNGHDFE